MNNAFTQWDIQTFHQPLPHKNHDAYNITPHAITVADGATPLNETYPTDVGQFAQDACTEINTQLSTHNMTKAYRNAITTLQQTYPPAGHLRTTGTGTAHIQQNIITFATLGDVTCYIQTSNKTITLQDQRLIKLDNTIPDNSPLTSYLHNRTLANTNKGYPIFADNPNTANHLTQTTMPTANIQAFIIATDGAWRLFNTTPTDFITMATRQGLTQTLTRYQNKTSYTYTDDATIILAIQKTSENITT